MRRISTFAAVAVAAAAFSAPAGAATATLDQHQTEFDVTYSAFGPDLGGSIDRRALVQTFTAGLTGDLVRVELGLGGGFPGVVEPLTVELRDTGASGAPGGAVLAGASLAPADVPSCCVPGQPELPIELSPPPSITRGEQYAIVIYTSGSGIYRWFGANQNAFGTVPDYTGGSAWFSRTSPPVTWEAEDADLAFKTYVLPTYSFGGFASPVDAGMVNTAKAGATIPVRWHLEAADGTPSSDPSSFASVTSKAGSGACAGLPTDAIEDYSGGSGLHYLGGGDWQFNWKVPKSYAGQCRTLVLTLSDGSTHTASFEFR